jgi:hypothetical protein
VNPAVRLAEIVTALEQVERISRAPMQANILEGIR